MGSRRPHCIFWQSLWRSNTVAESLPEVFLQRCAAILSAEDLAALLSAHASPPVAVRWTGCPESLHEASAYLHAHEISTSPVAWYDHAWRVQFADREVLVRLPWVESQQIFVQSLSSMAAVLNMGILPGMDILDLCAAPGAKTSLIRRLQQGSGVLVANDVSQARTQRLKHLLNMQGFDGIDVQTGDARSLGGVMESCFDRVLADVPCSGEGRFVRARPEAWSTWNERSISMLAKRQLKLLESACRCLRVGGEVLYATCTMAPEENEGVLHQFFDRRARRGDFGMSMVPIEWAVDQRRPPLTQWRGLLFRDEVKESVRVVAGDGMTPFFMARLRREP